MMTMTKAEGMGEELAETKTDLNKDDALRQKIMGFTANYEGGICRFYRMPLDTLNSLVENGLADLDDRQNESPSIREYLGLLRKHPSEPAALHGYLVSPDRDDCRITIEGLECTSANKYFISDLRSLLKNYPCGVIKIKRGHQYCWYD